MRHLHACCLALTTLFTALCLAVLRVSDGFERIQTGWEHDMVGKADGWNEERARSQKGSGSRRGIELQL